MTVKEIYNTLNALGFHVTSYSAPDPDNSYEQSVHFQIIIQDIFKGLVIHDSIINEVREIYVSNQGFQISRKTGVSSKWIYRNSESMEYDKSRTIFEEFLPWKADLNHTETEEFIKWLLPNDSLIGVQEIGVFL